MSSDILRKVYKADNKLTELATGNNISIDGVDVVKENWNAEGSEDSRVNNVGVGTNSLTVQSSQPILRFVPGWAGFST